MSAINELKRCSKCKCMKLLKFYSIRENTGKMLKTCISCREKHICNLCEFKCDSISNLKQHIQGVHNKNKNFKCDLCDYECSLNGNLKQHIQGVHNKNKEFKCDLCEFKCDSNGNLNQHIQGVHNKNLSYLCNLCEYKSSSNGNLKQHIKGVHNKLNNFSCELCEYKSSSNANLKRHIKKIHIEKYNGDLHISGGELAVMKALEILNIQYKREVASMIEHQRQRFDFEIKINDEIRYIEFDGRQHYVPVCFNGMSIEKATERFEKQKMRDAIKNEWCKENNFKLLRICYKDFDNVFEIIKNYII